MDDRELEARLRRRLLNRFDDAPVPSDLGSKVRQALATAPQGVRFDIRTSGLRFGWPAAAAAAVFAIAITLAANVVGPLAPGTGPSAKPTPASTPGPFDKRQFIVLPPGRLPSKPETSLAQDVLAARVHALGFDNFGSGAGYGIHFTLPADGASDAVIRAVLAATGDVEFVPLPPADYPDGAASDLVGKRLPTDEPALFGWEGIESVAMDDSQQFPAISLVLKPAAKSAFADYTTGHLRESMAVVVDGLVTLVPIINEPMLGGQVSITGGGSADPGDPAETFTITAAVLVGGMLPEAWRGAAVPAIVSQASAVEAARGRFPNNQVGTAELTVEPEGDAWRAVWIVEVSGVVSAVVPCPTPGPGPTCPILSSNRRVVIDAVRGGVLRVEIPSE